MQLLHQIPNIKAFLLHGQHCFFVKKGEKTLYKDGIALCEIKGLASSLGKLHFLSDEKLIITANYDNSGVIFDINTLSETPILKFEKSVWGIHSTYISFYGYANTSSKSYKDRKRISGLYDYQKDEVLMESEHLGQYWFGEFNVKKEIYNIVFNIPPHLINLWSFSSSAHFPPFKGFSATQFQDTHIEEVLGVYNQLLWLRLGGFRLLALDIATGEIVHSIENFVKVVDNAPFNNFLDTEKGLIKVFILDTYREFDLNKLAFTKEVKIQMSEEFWARYSTYYQGDKNLYFCGHHGQTFPNIYGIFDTNLGKVTWMKEMIMEGKGNAILTPPHANAHLLGLLDAKDTLWLYKREEK